jgi:hypothetical protein
MLGFSGSPYAIVLGTEVKKWIPAAQSGQLPRRYPALNLSREIVNI